MSSDKVVQAHTSTFDYNNPETRRLIELAQEANDLDAQLTIRQALRKYKKGVAWAMLLSTALIMEGYDIVIINSFFGQTQFKEKYGDIVDATGARQVSAPWQSGLTNSAVVGQLIGLIVNGYCQDRLGCRLTYMIFMGWMAGAIFAPFFAPNLSVLAFGEALCGVSWGVFQTLSTAYASEVVPTVLRPYVTGYVCMCWGAGILLASGVIRAVLNLEGEWGYRLPFALQWIWPIPLFLIGFFAPESPWNAVRRGNKDLARRSLERLRSSESSSQDIDATLAYIEYTNQLELEETSGASFLECFKGTNLRRTEINMVTWATQILCGNAILAYSVVFLQAAGFSPEQSFNLNISLSACYIVGGIICWFMFPRVGRATIYMSGLAIMLVALIVTGGLGFSNSKGAQMAVGILLVFQTLVNMSTIGPACYPIVAEIPSGKLRYKTIVIGRFVYNLTGIFGNSVTPRMVNTTAWNWGAKTAWFYAGTNLLCLIWCWFRLPETKDRSFGEIDLLFQNKVPARKFRTTKVDQFAAMQASRPDHPEDEKKHEVVHVDNVSGAPMGAAHGGAAGQVSV